MHIYYSDLHLQHNPPYEIYSQKEKVPAWERPERATSILDTLRSRDWADIQMTEDFGPGPIKAVHTTTYLDYLESAFQRWEPCSPLRGTAFIPYTFGIKQETARKGDLPDQDGFFMTDASIAITASTFLAAVSAAHCALSAAQAISTRERSSFALCRPPGHHAGGEVCGGYCFLNNTAISAQWLTQFGKVAVLDIDYHAGNGTQSIFYERDDVLTVSLHADPRRAYPRYAGHADEIGAGKGTGFNRNFPLSVCWFSMKRST
jgi:acetoin utilization deacetylase AcuC-like enzyme